MRGMADVLMRARVSTLSVVVDHSLPQPPQFTATPTAPPQAQPKSKTFRMRAHQQESRKAKNAYSLDAPLGGNRMAKDGCTRIVHRSAASRPSHIEAATDAVGGLHLGRVVPEGTLMWSTKAVETEMGPILEAREGTNTGRKWAPETRNCTSTATERDFVVPRPAEKTFALERAAARHAARSQYAERGDMAPVAACAADHGQQIEELAVRSTSARGPLRIRQRLR